jgi:hypothetical protein
MSVVYAPISIGELLDKLTILEIKKEQLTDPNRLKNVLTEEDELRKLLAHINIPDLDTFFKELKEVNYQIWDSENVVRILDKENRLDQTFIDEAIKIRHYNDRRSVIKHTLNLKVNSKIIEEKSFFEK